MSKPTIYEGTVKPFLRFNAQEDAKSLRAALKGPDIKDNAIINVLTKRSNAERFKIISVYKHMYTEDLIADLKDELSGDFRDVIVALMTPPLDYWVSELNRAILDKDKDALIEILIPKTNKEISKIGAVYPDKFGKSLESDIAYYTSGDLKRFLAIICQATRSRAPSDPKTAAELAHTLYEVGAEKWDTDEKVWNSIFLSESFSQLSDAFKEYEKLTTVDIITAIQKKASGEIKKCILGIARYVQNRPFFFAEKLKMSMQDTKINNKTLIRLVVSRSELDLKNIKHEYRKVYGSDLEDDINKATTGSYSQTLVALVKGN